MKDPFSNTGCKYGDNECMVDPNMPCDSGSSCYRITCSLCKTEHRETEPAVVRQRPDRLNEDRDRMNYTGMTGRTLHARQKEHRADIDRMNQKNALVKHILKEHPGCSETPEFRMRMMTRHRSNLDRCIMEGLLIEKVDEKKRINCKTEWSKTRGLVRLTASKM